MANNPTNCGDYEHNGRGRFDEPVWKVRDGDRVCSYCGSMHPDDVRAFLDSADHLVNSIGGTDKSYKFYLYRRGSESPGTAKFYTWHATPELIAELRKAAELGHVTRTAARAQPN